MAWGTLNSEGSFRRSGRSFGFRTHVVALAIACALPLVLAGIYSMTSVADTERAVARTQILSIARAASAMTDEFMLSTQKTARALARSWSMNPALRDFYENCAMLAAEHGGSILLADRTGQQLFNTKLPYGATLPPVAGTAEFWQVVETGEARFGNVFASSIDQQPSLVPIKHADVVTHVMSFTYPLRMIDDLLKVQHFPAEWTVATVDGTGKVITGPADVIGRSASPQVAALPAAETEGFFALTSLHGVPLYLGVKRSPVTGWKTVIGIPQAIVDAPLHQSIERFALLGGVALLLALVTVSLIGRRLLGDLRRLAQAASALGARQAIPPLHSTVRELNHVAAALAAAATEREHGEQELRRSQQHLALAQRTAGVASVLRRLDGSGVEWSDEFYRLLGIARGEVEPSFESYLQFVHEEDRAMVLAAQTPARGGKEAWPEYRIRRRDGSERIVQSHAEPLVGENGKLAAILITFQDVTEQRAAELRERGLERQLQHSQRLEALGTLAGGIAHDLNNALVPVLALSKLVMKRLPEGSREQANLGTVVGAAERARDLVGRILAFSRQEKTPRQMVDLAAVLRDALKMSRASLPATLRIEEAIETVPSVYGDPGQLHQLIVNLLVNAGQAIGAAIGTISVSLGVVAVDAKDGAAAGTMVRLAIRDTGCGMDEGTVQRIFDPFFTTKPVGQGTGLGLSMAHSIVTQHEGRIAVESRPGQGSCFTIWLPIKQEAVAAA